MQIEIGILLLFFFALALGLRSRLSKSTQKRILVGLFGVIVITFLAFVIVAYLNDMIDTSGRGHSQSNVGPTPPRLLVAFLVALISAWKVKKALRYRKDNDLFIKEVASTKWIDKHKLKDAISYYIYLESSFYISLPCLIALSFVEILVPYLWHVAILFLVSHAIAYVWWLQSFSIKKVST